MLDGDDRSELQTQADRIAEATNRQITRVGRSFLLLKIGLVVLGGSLAVIAGFLNEPVVGELPWKQILGMGGGIMALLGGALVAFIEHDSPTELENARKAVDSAQRFLSERQQIAAQVESLGRLDSKRRHLIAAYHTMLEVTEQAIYQEISDPEKAIANLFDVSQRALLAAMGYEIDERYAISVYRKQATPDGEQLVRLVDRRADRAEERTNTRAWKAGEGYTGAAWQRNNEVLIADTQDETVLSAFHVPTNKIRDDDGQRYRSVASLPIRVGPENEIWGVLTVTSDKPERFTSRPNARAAQNVEAVRALQGMLALLAGYIYIKESSA